MKNKFYDIIMAILSLIVVCIIIIELNFNLSNVQIETLSIIDNVIWVIFGIDYFTRLFFSHNKREFILKNKVDLISIIPFNSIFRALRILKITRLFKLTKLAKLTKLVRLATVFTKFKSRINKFMKTNNFNYVVYLTLITIFIGAITISVVEKMDFADAIWWSFVTATTVGYGDISPVTATGRIIAAVLMLIGIGFIGMLTGTIATFFINNNIKNKTYKEEIINDVKNKLDKFDELTKEDIKNIYNVLNALKD